MSAQPDDKTLLPGTDVNQPEPTVYPMPAAPDGTVYPAAPGEQSASCPTCGRSVEAASGSGSGTGRLSGSGGVSSAGRMAGHFGPYQLLGEIAKGGMGIVYKARDTRVNHIVALKVITGGNVELFLHEVKTVISLDHPHVLPIHEYGEAEGRHYFTMPLMTAGSLQDLLRNNPLPPGEAARLIEQVAEGVQYAHERGILHRDIKPQNILLNVEGGGRVPRLSDFGLARVQGSEFSLSGDQAIGTPSYMPPEQTGQQRERIGPRADVYGLGAVLYAALAGRPPFQAAEELEVLRQVKEQEPVPPRQLNPTVPRDLETICLKCLHKEPERRYGSARELAEDLERFLTGQPVQARPVGAMERGWRWCRRNPAVASLAAAVLLVMAVGTGVSLGFAITAEANAEASRKNAEDARQKGEETLRAKKELEKQNEELELTVARSLLRPLALGMSANDPLTDPEIEALWELAGKRGLGVGSRFVEDASRAAVTSRQLRLRAGVALHAAVGLDEGKREEVERFLAKCLRDPKLEKQRVDLAWVALDLEMLSSDTAVAVGEGFTQTLTKTTNAFDLRELAKGLSAVAARLDPKDATRFCADAAASLTQAMTKTANYFSLGELAQGLSAVTARLAPKDAVRFCADAAASLTQALTKTRDPYALRALAEGLSAVAARLDPKDAVRFCAVATASLTQALTNTTALGALETLAEGLSAVAARLDSKNAADAAASLTQALTKTTNSKGLKVLSNSLWKCLVGPTPIELPLHTAVGVVLSASPTGFLVSPALLSPVFTPLECRLSTRDLVELLKNPLCVGQARGVILDQLENRYRQKFPSHWDFVRYAKQHLPDIDLLSPPKRPELPTARAKD